MSEYVEARVVSIKKEVYVVHTLSKKIPLLVSFPQVPTSAPTHDLHRPHVIPNPIGHVHTPTCHPVQLLDSPSPSNMISSHSFVA